MKPNKIMLITSVVFIALIGVCIASYFGYGATMINIDSEKSIINHLSRDKNSPIEILKIEKSGNYAAVLYTDPVEIKNNPMAVHLDGLVKSKYYSDKYELSGRNGGNQTEAMVLSSDFLSEENENNHICFIGNAAANESKCSVFEVDTEAACYVNRLDVIDVSKNQPYIIVNEYTLQSNSNLIIVYDGEIELRELTEE